MPKVSYIPKSRHPKQEHPSTGTKMDSIELEKVLKGCESLPVNGEKHMHGCIFPVIKDTLGANSSMYDQVKYDGVVFIDIDNISHDIADQIFDNFDKVFSKWPYYYAIQHSSSYYLKKDKAGLHIFFLTPSGNGYDYSNWARFALAMTAEVIKREIGVDLIALQKELRKKDDRNKILDTHNCVIGQRMFLFHSDYKINYYPEVCPQTFYDKNVDKLHSLYPNIIYLKQDEPTIATFENDYHFFGKVRKQVELEYGGKYNEYVIANFLRNVGWSEDKIVNLMLSIDSRDDAEYIKRHGRSKESHFKQIARTAKDRTITENQRDQAIAILSYCGVYVEEVKPNFYAYDPIKIYQLD